MPKLKSLALLCVVTFIAVGCGGAKSELDVVTATGKVTLDGQPLAEADIVAAPVGTTSGLGGGGRSNANGEFQLTHFRGEQGLPPGEYTITVSLRKRPDGSVPPANDPTPPIESNANETLPTRYSNPATTTLTATISAGAPPLDLKLTSEK